ncbi:Transposase IS116/IS110/IS902 family protein [Maioricimonas rarisocia]|uniref:Transposase IS116/IS110/IS902 family protein n=1 Tax=Maioricimonas rarisocia TaxID=2528026 RepID=A0A517Z2N2_9PLAN|nr:IS110 family transposase [Maioricimonas rarisocia]QDU35735.1 Transposase IS116/IS110/IS902 family protein [Maioricimonas rarisocia]QDU36520.1 Transposase IS116/IS110/IS902 family protein [Maioricimonas rarisocia]QDU36709.1 Transposase IS116/IS110/IS902 family protein [Maioricimonas rarisocia]QDU40581.1 Transposase IS116/IS110/IS902 family protein [Maioricimonas rarisocia]QDU41403.1 Transposase IS116/IS110/IS902 family protein [Maioricimonas rarisocia]
MSTVARFVGLDYHDDSVRVCVMDSQGNVLASRDVDNHWCDVASLVEHTLPDGCEQFTVEASLEACNGAAHLAHELIERAGWSVRLGHAGIVNRMKQNPDKSDKADAFILADLVRIGYLPRVWLAPQEIQDLRTLVRLRTQYVKRQTEIKLRIRALLRGLRLKAPKDINPWTRAWLAWLKATEMNEITTFVRDEHIEELERIKEKIGRVEAQLKKVTRGDAVVARLLSLDGVGWITAITMRAEIAHFERFNSGKQLARYCGVTPRNASSGKRQADAGLVKAGNNHLRQVLIQAAHRLINFDPHWKAFAHRLKKQGKEYNVIVAAVANRWVRRLYHHMQPERLLSP